MCGREPYTTADDKRLTWLKDVYVKNLEDWWESTLTHEGKSNNNLNGDLTDNNGDNNVNVFIHSIKGTVAPAKRCVF